MREMYLVVGPDGPFIGPAFINVAPLTGLTILCLVITCSISLWMDWTGNNGRQRIGPPTQSKKVSLSKPCRARVIAFYKKYAPEKISKVVDDVTWANVYVGREDELMEALVAKYGPEPPVNVGGKYRDRIVAIYQKYAPEKMERLDDPTWWDKYAEREESLMLALVAKYGPEP